MGSVESDVAVLKNDVGYLKEGIDEIKKSQGELFTKVNTALIKLAQKDGSDRTHSAWFLGIASVGGGIFVVIAEAVMRVFIK